MTVEEAWPWIVSVIDGVWLDISTGLTWYLPFKDELTVECGIFDTFTLNWRRRTITMTDIMGSSTWRFTLDSAGELMIYRGKVAYEMVFSGIIRDQDWMMARREMLDSIHNRLNEDIIG